jgi:hypothetical protein
MKVGALARDGAEVHQASCFSGLAEDLQVVVGMREEPEQIL